VNHAGAGVCWRFAPRLTALGLYGSCISRPAVRPRANHAGAGVWWRFVPRLTALGLYGSCISRPAVRPRANLAGGGVMLPAVSALRPHPGGASRW
jgi:hypothetical protein